MDFFDIITETPIHELNFPNDRGIRLYCKRDDLLPFSLGGNKVRIALQFYRDMMSKDADCMVAYGNSRSNLCRVLANLCRAKQIPIYMICSKEPHEEEHAETSNSRLIRLLGAHMIPCDRTNIAQTVESTMNMLSSQGYKPYYIYGNKFGEGNEGVPVGAYVDAYEEIQSWERQNKTCFSHIFTASGTGATLSGLVSGKLIMHGAEKIVGISISSREKDRAIRLIETAISSYFCHRRLKLPENYKNELILKTEYRQGGYGLYDDRILRIIKTQFRQNGLPLDPAYTGKAFWGMLQYIQEYDLSDCNLLFLHTGGSPLFYDTISVLEDSQK